MQRPDFFLDLDMDRVKRLRDVSGKIGRAISNLIKRSEEQDERLGQSTIAATYFRKAAANSLLMGDISIAREFFEEAARYYHLAGMPYGLLMEAMCGYRKSDWSWPSAIESAQGVYALLAGLGEIKQHPDFLKKLRHSLDEFRGKRLGIFALPLDQYLELFDAAYMTILEPNTRLYGIREALLPFVQAYSSALQRARRDKFHWQRLATVFHPVEPDVVGILVMTNNAILKRDLKLYDLLEGLPVSHEATSVLNYCLTHLAKRPNNRIEGDKE